MSGRRSQGAASASLTQLVDATSLQAMCRLLLPPFPDFSFTWTSHGCDGEAFARWMMRGTYTGTLPGVPGPTGASFELTGMDHFTFGPDGITSVVGITDQMTLMRQLGVDVQLSIAD